jgi:hypothetical protein
MSNFTKLAEHFEQYCYEYPVNSRKQHAVKIASLDPVGATKYARLASYTGEIPRPLEAVSGLQARAGYLSDEGRETLKDLEKIAGHMSPYELEKVLEEFDATYKLAQYNYYPNPHDTVFYPLGTKLAERWTGATESLSEETLRAYLESDQVFHLEERYDEDIVEALKKDPWVVFLSLPEPVKTFIARVANGHTL